MKRWYVVTPAYDVVVPVLDYGQGPIEHETDVIEIEAETRRDAISLGVREMLRLGWDWVSSQRCDGASPYTGVEAYCYDDLE